MLSQFLKQHNIEYQDLTTAEKETLENWQRALEKTELTVDKIREYVTLMKDSVEQELAVYDLPKEKDLCLKARLRNYLLLQAFLTSGEKAKKAMLEAIVNIKPRKNANPIT